MERCFLENVSRLPCNGCHDFLNDFNTIMPTAEAIASTVRSNIVPSVEALSSMVLSLSKSIGTICSITDNLIPRRFQDWFQDYLLSTLCTLIKRNFSPTVSVFINESDGTFTNEVYDAAEIYLSTKLSPTMQSLTIVKFEREKKIRVTIDGDEEVVDKYQGIIFKWRRKTHKVEREHFISSHRASKFRSFELRFHKKHTQLVIDSYFPFILSESKAITENSNTLKVNRIQNEDQRGRWTVVNVNRPTTFMTLAMDSDLMKEVIADLERVLRMKEFYKRIEKSWKRIYVLHGPPGTGKTSLVEAMAEFLHFSVYYSVLTQLRGDSMLKNLLMETNEQSIIVFEDKEQGEQARQALSLSQVLRFINEMPSSFQEARIFIFTTNDMEQLDSSFLDADIMCIHMSYLKASAFDILASNCLGIEDHLLFEEIRQLLTRVEVTPVQVIEELISSSNADVSLKRVIKLLRRKKRVQPELCGIAAILEIFTENPILEQPHIRTADLISLTVGE